MMRKLASCAGLVVATMLLLGCAVISTQLGWFANGQMFAGEVHNFTKTPIVGHGITVHWLDGDGNVVRTSVTAGCLHSLPPGASDFFEAWSAGDSDLGGVTAEVSPLFSVGEPAESGLQVLDVQSERSSGVLRVAVTLYNSGAATLAAPRACVVVRNAAGNVVRVSGLEAPTMPAGYRQTVRATRGVPHSGELTVEVWADALLADGVPVTPVEHPPIAIAAPARLTGITRLDPILEVIGAGSTSAVRPYIGYQTYICRGGVTPPGGDPCRPGEAGQTISVFPVGSCEGGLLRSDEIDAVLDQLADPRVQLYGVYHATAEQRADYIAVYANAWEAGRPHARFAAAVHVTNGRITALLYSCGAPDPGQLARGAGAALLEPVRIQ